jgi:hypothetical protein
MLAGPVDSGPVSEDHQQQAGVSEPGVRARVRRVLRDSPPEVGDGAAYAGGGALVGEVLRAEIQLVRGDVARGSLHEARPLATRPQPHPEGADDGALGLLLHGEDSTISRSYGSAQSTAPSAARTSWTPTLSRPRVRRTLPWSTAATPSDSATARPLSDVPLKANADVRLVTVRPATLPSAPISSSVRPSAKASSAGSPFAFASGSTATEGRAAGTTT